MGVFGLVSNLGSLFVRLVLQPFEEIAFMTFATSNTKEKKKKNLIDILSISVLVGSIAFFIGPLLAKINICTFFTVKYGWKMGQKR